MSRRVLYVWAPLMVERYLSAAALAALRDADVLVVDRTVGRFGTVDCPGAVRILVDPGPEAARAVLEELESGQTVVRVVDPAHDAAAREELAALRAAGVTVAHRASVRPEDEVLRAQGENPDTLAAWPPPPRHRAWRVDRADGPDLVRRLLDEGADPDEPARLMRLPDGRPEPPATLRTLDWSQDTGRAILLVGSDAVRERSAGLFGRRVLVLRAAGQHEGVAERLEAMGAWPLVAPSIAVRPADWTAVDPLLRNVHRYQWVVFTSANGVAFFFDRMRYLGLDIRQMGGKIAAVGPKTAERIRDLCLVPALVPQEEANQEGLLAAFEAIRPRGASILLVVGDRRRPDLAEGLRRLGAVVQEAVVYRTVPAPLEPWVDEALRDGAVDVVLFTSGTTAEYLLEQLSPAARERVGALCTVSIGPRTTAAVRALGLPVCFESPVPDLDALVDALADHWRAAAGHGAPVTTERRRDHVSD
ncbi:MAG: uroporphyrinogen-III synthase [Actinomycetia bacterium]|nr:uroporphyrinogen-III synthase [Actinomycetes bacterium]